jgi:NAD(P) transhydrogenase subunit alpha
MILGVVKETFPGERRVALVPFSIAALQKMKHEVLVEPGAGVEAGYPDSEYAEKGARIAASRDEVWKNADTILQVRALGSNPQAGQSDLAAMRKGQAVIGMADPLAAPDAARRVGQTGALLFSLELMPRITRAQSMDVLSSMATIAGYKAVSMAADRLPKMFPLMMTAAGTLRAAHVFIVGAGVAGLQAIGSARKLGAIVEAYDVRPVVKEQVQSLGAKFVEMELEAGAAEDKGGYAKELGEDFYRKQRELMLKVVAHSDVVITTAAIPGKKAPILITREMVEAMAPGSIVVDLAAERGGNCELTRPGEEVLHNGVLILGPDNPASTIPYHASQMFSNNVTTFLKHLAPEGGLKLDLEDEITRETLVTKDGDVIHARVKEMLGAAAGAASGGGR